MSDPDHELDKIRLKKAEMYFKFQSLPKKIIEIHSLQEYNNLITNFPDNILVIDFWAIWCGPCMAFAKIFEQIQQEYINEGFIFAKVNVDENQAVARKYNITGIPTTLFVKGDQIIRKIVGLMNHENMKKLLEAFKSYNI